MDINSITKTYDELPQIVKIILQVIFNDLISGLYRIFRYVETKNVTTLVIGILSCITPVGFVFWIVDLVTTITKNKMTLCVD